MTTPLLQTKLYAPRVRPGLVSRPRLIARLNAGLRRKLTLISAPAGFGKTTLLSEWTQALTGNTPIRTALGAASPLGVVAWLSLDENDNDPTRFLAYLVAALQTVRADLGLVAVAMLQSPQPPPAEAILSALINEIATITREDQAGCPWVLVLDDYHRITARPVHQALTFLLDHLPPKMHLAIAGRADPPLPLARLRAGVQLTELRAADLRFSPDEVAAFLNDVMGLGLSTDDIATVDARTEGWIAGLQMAALSMRGREDARGFIKAFSGSHRFVLDYLVEEVLDQQPPCIQDFLLKTSILKRMIAPLCDAVTRGTDSQTILMRLDRANLFLIPLDDERRWYRYHHLFADLLRSRLEQTQIDQAPALHRRASEWYAQNGLIAEAVRHMLLVGDLERVADLVEGNALAMMDRGELKTLAESLDVLPDDVMSSRPWLSIAHAWVLAYVGHFDTIEPRLKDAERALINREGRAESHHVAGHIATIRGYITALKGDMSGAADLARSALEYLPEEDLRVRGVATAVLGGALKESGDLVAAAQALTRAIAIAQAAGDSHVAVTNLCDLTRLHILQGRLHEAAATCQCALDLADEYARQSGWRLPVIGHAYTHLSRVLREWNDLKTAIRLATKGVALCRQWGWSELLVHGGIYLAEIRQANRDTEGALDVIRMAKEAARSLSTRFIGLVEAHETRLWVAQGNVAAASRWVEQSGLSIDDALSFQDLPRYVTLARVLIARSSLDEASKLLARVLNMAETAGAIGYSIEILALQAIALQARTRSDRALMPLERALSLAEPEGYVRTFIDEGEPMGHLLRQAAAQGMRLEYVSALLTAFETDTKGKDAHPALVEPLSERELEVLRVLATGLSNKEIAETLFIAVGTVKQHLKSIYGKLGVHSRTEAAHRARHLGLL